MTRLFVVDSNKGNHLTVWKKKLAHARLKWYLQNALSNHILNTYVLKGFAIK